MALDPLADCDLIVEAALEHVDLKVKLFAELDGIVKQDAILATNTSSISVTKIAAATKRPHQVVGMHFFNPVPVMQLVEVMRAPAERRRDLRSVVEISKKIGKTPHVVKDSYGFVVNRLLIPMINEGINCLYEGLAGPEDIDDTMKLGANHPIGPLALADLIGLDVILNVMETLYQGFEDRSTGRARCSSRWSTPATSAASPDAASTSTPPERRIPASSPGRGGGGLLVPGARSPTRPARRRRS